LHKLGLIGKGGVRQGPEIEQISQTGQVFNLRQHRISTAASILVYGLLLPSVVSADSTADGGTPLFVYIISIGLFAVSLIVLGAYAYRLILQLKSSRADIGRLNDEWRRKLASLEDPAGDTARELFNARERTQIILQCSGDAVVITNAKGMVEEVNPFAARMLDASIAEGEKRPSSEVLRLLNQSTRDPIDDPIARALAGKFDIVEEEHRLLIGTDGNEYTVNLLAVPVLDKDGTPSGCIVTLHDVTEMFGMVRKLSYQATHDPLTGLVNRHEFEVRLQQAIESASVDRTQHALLYMDIDLFKVANETLGYRAGDELLRQIVSRLKQVVRHGDTLARLGGDEFGLLLNACPVKKAEQIAESIRKSIKEDRFHWDGKQFDFGITIGLVPVAADSGSRADLLNVAEAACSVAKDAGGNRVQLYEAHDIAMARHRGEMQWVHRITEALDEDRFVLYSQEIRSLDEPDKGRHLEILLRLQDKKGNIIPPNEFIPAAERYQLMPSIDRWVIEHTLSDFHHIQQEGGAIASCAINLSGQSLCDEGFLEYVVKCIKYSTIPPAKICFEITETAVIANLNIAIRFMTVLREMGVRFALDDFGSGLSSFAYLKNLSVDYLKIDGAFVRNMAHDKIDYAMVSSINEIGQLMGIQTIAEFVENDAILEKLQELKVNYVQGYGIGRPQPIRSEIEAHQITG
jgi:diguanylate cyclase (GGDEF)-like protein/PAS domain S-box-containing protein